ncbi:MAG: hypothetical protein HY690_04885, partial [Chloroflexi bacterium]|nr:hypothetical protein [Chloroflexota bacterium]
MYDLVELRCAVDTDRKAAGLAAVSWEDPAIVAGTGVAVRARHFTQVRESLQDLWTAAGLGLLPEFTAGAIPTTPPIARPVKTSDLEDLRNWLMQYELSDWGQTKRARVYQEYDVSDPASGQYGKGRRTGLSDSCGGGTFRWDAAGRLALEKRVLDGFTYITQT